MKSKNKNKDRLTFDKEFTKQEPLPEESLRKAIEIMKSGRLHRYNTAPREASETSLLEEEFAAYVGKKYCLACSSCGSAIYLALKSVGVSPGDKILCNAFTLAPVPGAIENTGAQTILVDIREDYTIDLEDLENAASESGAQYLLLSHMRGHMADMDRICMICDRYNLVLIEDCAHTLGATWADRPSGTFGQFGCFSTQTYKHMNSGEGGLLVTDDEEAMAKAILYSGSYMLYDRHISRPSLEVFDKFKKMTPNFSLRMDNLRAAVLRPQLKKLRNQCERWNERYDLLATELNRINHIRIPMRNPKEHYVGSSIQFSLTGMERRQVIEFLDESHQRGLDIKWFGWPEPKGFTSSYDSWEYIQDMRKLPKTKRILDFMCDFRIPLTFTLEDCRLIARIIKQVIDNIFG